MPVYINVEGDVYQDNTAILYFELTDYDHTTPVSVDAITTATLTLRDHVSKAIINNREDVDVKPNFDTEGHFEFLLDAADNPMVTPGEKLDHEYHYATIKLVAAGQTHAIILERDFRIKIINQEHVA